MQLSNIDYAVVKGEPLSMLAYNKFGLRTSCDIDLLISQNGLDSIAFIRLIVALEEEFEVEIPDKYILLSDMNTVNKIYNVLKTIK